MSKNVVTLYIDDTGLRLLVANGKRVEKWAHLPLEPRLVSDGTIVDEAQVAIKVKEFFRDQGVQTGKVIAGFSGLHCLTRPILLPKLPKTLLPEAVNREAENILPVPLDQLYISWQIIGSSRDEIHAFLAASHRNAIDALVRTLRQAGLDPYIVDTKPLALARVVSKPTAIVIDLQPTELDIVVMVDGIPQPVRSLSLPSKIATVPEKLSMVREDIERTIKFYNSSHLEKPLDPGTPIFISGELAQETEACQSLAGELKYPVLPLASPLECPQDMEPGQYMVNIGLALTEIPLPKTKGNLLAINLNLLPEVYKPKPVSLTNIAKVLIAPVIILIAISLLFPVVERVQTAAAEAESLAAQIDTTNLLLQQRIKKQETQKKEIAELEVKAGEVKSSLDTFKAVVYYIEEQSYAANSNLQVSIAALPSTVTLTDINHSGRSLVVQGEAPSETEVLVYAKNLRDSAWFSNVTISSLEKTEDGATFTLTLAGS